MSDGLRRQRPHILAVTNQKGGVGKTTTSINLAAAFVEKGLRVLVVDLDPQGNASTGLGVGLNDRTRNTYDLIVEEAPLLDVLQETSVPGLFISPSTADLSSADMELMSREKRSFLLHDALRQPDMATLDLDYIVIDCPPSLNLLTVNALVASHAVLIPLQTEFFALEGLSHLMTTIRDVRQMANPTLRIEGVLLTMHDSRNRLCQQVEADARGALGELVFRSVIPRNVRVSEAPSYSMPVLSYDPSSKGAEAYRALAAEILARHPNGDSK